MYKYIYIPLYKPRTYIIEADEFIVCLFSMTTENGERKLQGETCLKKHCAIFPQDK